MTSLILIPEARAAVTITAASTTSVADSRLYQLLRQEITAAGCFKPTRLASSVHVFLVLLVYCGAYIALLQGPDWGLRSVLGFLLAATCVQASFLGHEFGHFGCNGKRQLSRRLGYLFMSLLTGYAQTHYLQNHKQHHAHPNDTERDPDIQGAGVLSFYPASVATKTGLAKRVTHWQAYLIWPLLSLQAFSLKIRGLKLVFGRFGSYPAEKTLLALHYVLWLGLPAVLLGPGDALLNYALISLLVGLYLGCVVLINHVGMPMRSPDGKAPFFQKTLTTTRDLGSTRLNDILFGGTNNHIEHHLFPAVPIHRLGTARKITRNFCLQHNLTYKETTWGQAAREVFRSLDEISQHARRHQSDRRQNVNGETT